MSYSDYLSLREGYYSTISKINIEDENNKWTDTYPHETFIAVLKRLATMLDRNDKAAKKPLWLHGAFGSGKSRIAWTLREILNCSPEELNAYFDEYRELKELESLRQKLLTSKKEGKIVTAMRFSSGDITSLDELIIAVYQSVSEALEAGGFDPLADNTLLGGMIKYLEDDVNRNVLTQIITSPPYNTSGNIPNDGNAILEALRSSGEKRALLKSLMAIFRERHIIAISFDIQALCDWLREVIDKNELKAIVFLWDEFSDFFYKNRGLYGDFQELAHLSTRVPFYLIIVTHFYRLLFEKDDPAAQVISDRFHLENITLPDHTAFKLLGHAYKPKIGIETQWEDICNDLYERIKEARRGVVDKASELQRLEDADFRAILPVHPFAALILKNVATLFASNQRSMFDFMSVKDENIQAFQWFLNNRSPDKPDILGVDFLWDYFYTSGKDKLGIGRDNLDSRAREILEAYPVIAKRYEGTDELGRPCDTDQQRILKIIILLQALRAKNPQVVYLSATKEILEIAFSGTDLDYGRGLSLADQMVSEKILFVDNGIYQIPLGNAVNQVDIQKLANNIRDEIKTNEMINDFDIWEILPSREAIKRRFVVRMATASDFPKQLNGLINRENRPWEMKILMLFARNDIEGDELRTKLQETFEDQRANNIYFLDATATTLSSENFEEFIMARAKHQYFAGKDNSQASLMEKAEKDILRVWRSRIAQGKFTIYSSRNRTGKFCPNGDEAIGYLKQLIIDKYPDCMDFTEKVTDTCFRNQDTSVIKAGFEGKNQGAISMQIAQILLADARIDKYWELVPDRPLSRLKKWLEKEAEKSFRAGGTGRLKISSVIDYFMERGFMPTLLSSYLTAFLLKEYGDQKFRYSDGETGDFMTADKLAEIIAEYFRYLNTPGIKYRDKFIEVLTSEQRAFADLAGKLFNLESKDSLERIAREIANKVKIWGYPLWVLHSLPEFTGFSDYIDLFAALFNQSGLETGGCADIASKIGKMIQENPEALEELKNLFCQESLEKGMQAWLNNWKYGEFIRIANAIGVTDPLGDARSCFGDDGTWLWNRETGENALEGLFKQYLLAEKSVSNGFLVSAKSRFECFEGWKQKIMELRMPAAVFQERYPDQKAVISAFLDIVRDIPLTASKEDKLLDALSKSPERLIDIFNNVRELFANLYANELINLTESEKNRLYSSLPQTSFREDRNVFEKELRIKVENLAMKLKRGELRDFLQQTVGFESPFELARQVRTPLRALLSFYLNGDEYESAMRASSVSQNPNAIEKDISSALAYWTSHRDLLEKIKEQTHADIAFMKLIGDSNAAILKNPNAIRDELAKQLGEDVNVWLDNPNWPNIIKNLAMQKYIENGRVAVQEKINGMRAEDAKNFLLEVANDNFEIGMKILGA